MQECTLPANDSFGVRALPCLLQRLGLPPFTVVQDTGSADNSTENHTDSTAIDVVH